MAFVVFLLAIHNHPISPLFLVTLLPQKKFFYKSFSSFSIISRFIFIKYFKSFTAVSHHFFLYMFYCVFVGYLSSTFPLYIQSHKELIFPPPHSPFFIISSVFLFTTFFVKILNPFSFIFFYHTF